MRPQRPRGCQGQPSHQQMLPGRATSRPAPGVLGLPSSVCTSTQIPTLSPAHSAFHWPSGKTSALPRHHSWWASPRDQRGLQGEMGAPLALPGCAPESSWRSCLTVAGLRGAPPAPPPPVRTGEKWGDAGKWACAECEHRWARRRGWRGPTCPQRDRNSQQPVAGVSGDQLAPTWGRSPTGATRSFQEPPP